MQVKLSPSVRALANGAVHDKDGSPILKGVLVKETEAVVADGWMLIVKQLPSPEMALDQIIDDGVKQIIIPADALKACDSGDVALSCVESIRPASGLDIGERRRIIARLDGVDFDVEAEAIEGTYPDYPKMFTRHPLKAQVALNTSILKKLLKCLPDGMPLMLRIGEFDKPVEFQCSDPDGDIPIAGVVMPMALNFDNVKWRSSEEVKQ